MREPDSLPDPTRPAGTPDPSMPFDHIVVVVMENHSFDNMLGALSRVGQVDADGLSFDAGGQATNENPGADGPVRSFAFPSTAQGPRVSQSWEATHAQIDDGRMDGFVKSVRADQAMGYYPPEVVPFCYSLASTFTAANRWFCSAPGPTIPNRRFLLAGTAYGAVATDVPTLFDGSPPNGTIFDRLGKHGISWHNYFTDMPGTVVIPKVVEDHFVHLRTIDSFFDHCASGDLPAVSFVDPEAGILAYMGELLEKIPILKALGAKIAKHGGDEEDPQDLYYGELGAHRIVQAVLDSPAWPRTLMIYSYDEHGGYYDHVAPLDAIRPDDIPPKGVPGTYGSYGVRVPAVIASPYCRPGAVSNVIYDHTSVLATIEAKWNLPALTYRDANANTVMDCLDPGTLAFPTGPQLSAPQDSGPSGPVS